MDSFTFYCLAIPVVLMVGLSKGGFAGGLGILAVPLLSLMIDPRAAAAILLPILCAMDVFSLWSFRGTWHKQNFFYLLPGAVVGTVAGALTFSMTNADVVRIIVGVLSIYFVFHYVWGKHYLENARKTLPSPVSGNFWGSVAGYTSYIAHAGGPPVSIYLLPQGLSKTAFVGTSVLFFSLINWIKMIPYVALGQLNLDLFWVSLTLMPLAPIGVWLGVYLHKRMSDRLFYGLSYFFLLLAGIKLLYEGISHII